MSSHKHIKDFFQRFALLAPTERIIKEAACRAIYAATKITIPPQSMVYHNNTLYIKETPFVKGEILIHKKTILETLKKELPKNNPHNML